MTGQQPTCDLYVSHGAPRVGGLDWFIVKPAPNGSIDDEVQRLLNADRTVYHIMAKPCLTKRLVQKRPVRLKPTGISPRRRNRPPE